MQSALAEWSGQRTVPNVFIKEAHIGGCDSKYTLIFLPITISHNTNELWQTINTFYCNVFWNSCCGMGFLFCRCDGDPQRWKADSFVDRYRSHCCLIRQRNIKYPPESDFYDVPHIHTKYQPIDLIFICMCTFYCYWNKNLYKKLVFCYVCMTYHCIVCWKTYMVEIRFWIQIYLIIYDNR